MKFTTMVIWLLFAPVLLAQEHAFIGGVPLPLNEQGEALIEGQAVDLEHVEPYPRQPGQPLCVKVCQKQHPDIGKPLNNSWNLYCLET